MANNTVEIALKLLKSEFEKDSKSAANAYTADLKKIEKASEQLSTAQRKAKRESDRLNAARSNLGVKSLRDQQREIAKLTTSYQRLARSGTLSSREIREAQEALRRKVSEVRGELQRESKTIAGLAKQLAPFIGVGAAALFTKNLAGSAITAADDYTRLNSQLRLVSDSEKELIETNEKLFELAQQTRSEFAPVVELYARAARATKNLNISQQSLFTITRAVNQSMQISGATSSEASSAVLQFTQALQSGVLRGEEFNSVSENGARLMFALADGMGVPIEAMREMAEAGELTRDRLIAALTDQADELNAEFNKLEITVDQALTQLKNSFQRAAATTDTAPLVAAIQNLTAVVNNPDLVKGLSTFTGLLVGLLSTVIEVTAGIGNFADETKTAFRLAFDDSVTDIERIDAKLKALRENVGKSFDIDLVGFTPVIQLIDREETNKQIKFLEALRTAKLDAAGVKDPEVEKQAQEQLQRERARAEKIISVNKEIANVKNNLSALGLERDKTIAKEELRITKEKGSELVRLIKQDLNTQKQAINDRVKLVKDAGQKIIDIEREIADERRNIQDIDRNVKDKLFERSLTGKSETQQQAELEARAAEKLIEARKALSEGRNKEAARQAQEVQSISDRLTNIDKANALLVAGADVEKKVSQETIISREKSATALQKYQDLQRQAIALQREELEYQQTSIDLLTERLQALGNESPTIEIDSNIADLNKQLDQLQSKLNRLATTGFAVGGQIPGFQTGGQVGRQLIMAEDGEWYLPPDVVKHYGTSTISALNAMQLPKFAEGGKLPGYGGGDRRLMAPKIGGYIIRKEAARLYGDGVMSAILNKKLPKFQTGGEIRINPGLLNLPGFNTGGKLTGGSVSASDIPTQRHIIEVGRSEYTIFGEHDQVNGLINALNEVARGG